MFAVCSLMIFLLCYVFLLHLYLNLLVSIFEPLSINICLKPPIAYAVSIMLLFGTFAYAIYLSICNSTIFRIKKEGIIIIIIITIKGDKRG